MNRASHTIRRFLSESGLAGVMVEIAYNGRHVDARLLATGCDGQIIGSLYLGGGTKQALRDSIQQVRTIREVCAEAETVFDALESFLPDEAEKSADCGGLELMGQGAVEVPGPNPARPQQVDAGAYADEAPARDPLVSERVAAAERALSKALA